MYSILVICVKWWLGYHEKVFLLSKFSSNKTKLCTDFS